MTTPTPTTAAAIAAALAAAAKAATTTTPAPTTPVAAAPTVTAAQKTALAALHAYLDAVAVAGPGAPDTPALREARALRTALEEAFPGALPVPSPIVTATA